MEWITNNWPELTVVVVAVLALIIYVIYRCYKKGLKQVAIDFIVWAEKSMESEEGSAKFEAVVNKVCALVPLPLSLFITKTSIEKLVQSMFDSIKEALDYVPSSLQSPRNEKGE